MASGGCGEVRQRLVAADVERAQRDPPPVERFGERAVDRDLLLDVGGVVPAEEQELGAHQAGEVGAWSAAARRRRPSRCWRRPAPSTPSRVTAGCARRRRARRAA